MSVRIPNVIRWYADNFLDRRNKIDEKTEKNLVWQKAIENVKVRACDKTKSPVDWTFV